jgi:hypothetical protein
MQTGERICASCGRQVLTEDRYCPSCGTAFVGSPPRFELRQMPGFGYHFIQGLGWGLGFTVAGIVAWIIFAFIIGVLIRPNYYY